MSLQRAALDAVRNGLARVDKQLAGRRRARGRIAQSALIAVDPKSGDVLESVQLPAGVNVSGLESNGKDTFYCGGGGTGKVRAVTRGGS